MNSAARVNKLRGPKILQRTLGYTNLFLKRLLDLVGHDWGERRYPRRDLLADNNIVVSPKCNAKTHSERNLLLLGHG